MLMVDEENVEVEIMDDNNVQEVETVEEEFLQ